jgi:hypothetical protein
MESLKKRMELIQSIVWNQAIRHTAIRIPYTPSVIPYQALGLDKKEHCARNALF